MAKKPTMDDIARKLGISKSLVSKAISGKYGVSEAMRQNILDVAREIDYPLYDERKHESINTSTTTVTVVVDREGFANTIFWVKIIDRLESELQLHGANMILSVVEVDDRYYIERNGNHTDGYIVLGLVHEGVLNGIEKKGKPIVLLDYKTLDANHDHIRVNNRIGMNKMMNLVMKNNHKNLLFVGDVDFAASIQERYDGIKNYIEKHPELGVKVFYSPVGTGTRVMEMADDIIQLLKEKEQQNEKITAVFGSNDSVAISVIKILLKAGFNIPKDISVVGFDNIRESQFIEPRLTTVDVPKIELAVFAVDRLLKKIANPGRVNALIMIEPQIVERASLSDCSE